MGFVFIWFYVGAALWGGIFYGRDACAAVLRGASGSMVGGLFRQAVCV